MKDTIAAICTALSPSGIGIIRVSGEDAIPIVDKIFKTPVGNSLLNAKSHTVHYGHIYDNERIVDEVLVILMKAPRSYTMEDVVEIDCHGGLLVLRKVFNLLLASGCRPSEPGEFTKRAFLNGRIDLTEAEAVMDLISSKSEIERLNSISVLNGSLLNKIKSIREEILYFIAKIEASLDDPEHMSLDGYEDEISNKISIINTEIDKLISSYDNGKLINEGIYTVIVGKPNVGKSSVLNMLLSEDRAIVTEIAGTTRDTLEESIVLDGITFRLIDTAGIRFTDDIVEKIGIKRAENCIKKADLVVYIVDSSRELDRYDDHIISLLEGKKTICLFNKCDLPSVVSFMELNSHFEGHDSKPVCIKSSALLNIGKDEFIQIVKDMFFNGEVTFNDEIIVTKLRHKSLLNDAKSSLEKVISSIDNCMPEDFLSIDLMDAYSSLGEIIGEEVSDDLVDKIFSEFCMGK